MTQRHNGGDQDNQDFVNGQLRQLFDDDEFLTDLSRGVDPTEGEDALAGLLLNLKKEVETDMPAAPDLSVLLPGFGDLREGSDKGSNPGTTEFAPITDSENTTDTSVIALDSQREKHQKREQRGKRDSKRNVDKTTRTSHPFLSGLVGAAAATLVIAGGGTAIYNADADSPLYGMNQQIFGNDEHPSVVELASTLEEVDSRTASGDVEGARQLLEQARTMLNDMNAREAQEPVTQSSVPTTETVTNTVTETSVSEQPAPTPETITETQTQVQTVTSTVVAPPVWTPEPSSPVVPTVPSTPTEGTQAPGEDDGLAPPQVPGN